MNIKQLYGYLFYFFFSIWRKVDKAFGASGPFSTSMKSLVCMFAVEVWAVFSIVLYLGYFFYQHRQPNLLIFCAFPSLILLVIKWFIFEKNDEWKKYVEEFDEWPKKRNRTWLLMFTFLIIFIIFNFMYALYLNPPPQGLKW